MLRNSRGSDKLPSLRCQPRPLGHNSLNPSFLTNPPALPSRSLPAKVCGLLRILNPIDSPCFEGKHSVHAVQFNTIMLATLIATILGPLGHPLTWPVQLLIYYLFALFLRAVIRIIVSDLRRARSALDSFIRLFSPCLPPTIGTSPSLSTAAPNGDSAPDGARAPPLASLHSDLLPLSPPLPASSSCLPDPARSSTPPASLSPAPATGQGLVPRRLPPNQRAPLKVAVKVGGTGSHASHAGVATGGAARQPESGRGNGSRGRTTAHNGTARSEVNDEDSPLEPPLLARGGRKQGSNSAGALACCPEVDCDPHPPTPRFRKVGPRGSATGRSSPRGVPPCQSEASDFDGCVYREARISGGERAGGGWGKGRGGGELHPNAPHLSRNDIVCGSDVGVDLPKADDQETVQSPLPPHLVPLPPSPCGTSSPVTDVSSPTPSPTVHPVVHESTFAPPRPPPLSLFPLRAVGDSRASSATPRGVPFHSSPFGCGVPPALTGSLGERKGGLCEGSDVPLSLGASVVPSSTSAALPSLFPARAGATAKTPTSTASFLHSSRDVTAGTGSDAVAPMVDIFGLRGGATDKR